MKKVLIFIGLLALVSCATVNERQAACEAQYPAFADMVACLKQEVAEMPQRKWADNRDEDLLRLYLAYADYAVDKVKNGQMSEPEARLNLAQMYIHIKQMADERDAQEASIKEQEARARALNQQASSQALSDSTQPLLNFQRWLYSQGQNNKTYETWCNQTGNQTYCTTR